MQASPLGKEDEPTANYDLMAVTTLEKNKYMLQAKLSDTGVDGVVDAKFLPLHTQVQFAVWSRRYSAALPRCDRRTLADGTSSARVSCHCAPVPPYFR
jgi:hypothetical protein